MHCSTALTTALAALSLFVSSALASPPHKVDRAKRHASIRSAFSPRSKVRRQDFLSTTQPSNLAEGSATAEEGCTLWIQPWSDASCLAIITYSPGLILEDFLELNTAIDSSCSNLESNVAYCIDTDDSHEESSDGLATKTGNVLKASSCRTRKSSSNAATPTATPQIKASSPTATSTSKSKPPKVVGSGGGLAGLLELDDPVCGRSDPSKATSDTGGPNGKLSWLNCGISQQDPSSGWTYPNVHINQVIHQKMSKDGIYKPCEPFFKYFEEAEAKYNIPAIFFAAFAMQESTCNPNASGDEGSAWGLMQITTDKCGGAPNGKCDDPEYNVMTAASYFNSTLWDQCDGNPLCAVGQYNGWQKGMSYSSATASRYSCCVCQNNLDYMNQYFNHWLMNEDGTSYTHYDNLRPCDTWWNGR